MINAKEEILKHVENRKIKCIHLFTEGDNHAYLPVGHSEADLQAFLNALDVRYDNGYGWQTLYGNIWYEDGTWSERDEYDGSEWWEHRKIPEIPSELQQLVLPEL